MGCKVFLLLIIYLGFLYDSILKPSFWGSIVEEGYKESLVFEKGMVP